MADAICYFVGFHGVGIIDRAQNAVSFFDDSSWRGSIDVHLSIAIDASSFEREKFQSHGKHCDELLYVCKLRRVANSQLVVGGVRYISHRCEYCWGDCAGGSFDGESYHSEGDIYEAVGSSKEGG
eukprot:CAMPEP_0196145568 /NCGR_PEP_ID=MMETSP0910-20130528/20627_1 /TAXON_ID=49265 /ORGANISM="Thalassiosira rotula, Strain GSO102" /LENGTH=124 /DNA_ID=CAMNT_0041407533 /DNA_START=604 /DNA_END=978 /DNA_ORIENTATION=+